MPIVNLDKINQKKIDLQNAFAQAVKDQDAEAMGKALADYTQYLSDTVVAEAKELADTTDSAVLSARGIRQLTSKEKEYYKAFIEAGKSGNVKQGITNISVAMPETIIDEALKDITTEHPLLAKIDFINTTAVTKWIINKEGEQRAAWGDIGDAITKELAGELGKVQTDLCKLSAFMYISNDMLDLGPQWIDRYVRLTLTEAVAISLEVAIVDGTGNEEPIGADRDVSDGVTVTGGVYPLKTPIAVTEFTPETYGTLLSQLAKSPNGKQRVVKDLVLIVNPTDYYSIVMPATTLLAPNGVYINNVLPVPTDIIQSVGTPSGHAVLGLAKRYFMGIGSAKNGKIEVDDSYKFLDDLTTYKIKLYGNGRAKDNNAFLYLDISALKATYPTVKNIPQTAITSAAVTDITAPVKDATPDTAATLTVSPTGSAAISSITWAPADTTFKAKTVYTATVVLEAKDNDYFGGKSGVTINGNAPTSKTISPSGAVLTATYTFLATGE